MCLDHVQYFYLFCLCCNALLNKVLFRFFALQIVLGLQNSNMPCILFCVDTVKGTSSLLNFSNSGNRNTTFNSLRFQNIPHYFLAIYETRKSSFIIMCLGIGVTSPFQFEFKVCLDQTYSSSFLTDLYCFSVSS